ncbi:MAG TPA: hypothetical protein VFR37_13215 [Longimicrobium sp.]|nr:hypothetical protein [Longimicrobium sp.]
MLKSIRIAAAVLGAASLGACIPGASPSGPAPRGEAISRTELEASGAPDLYQAVQRLRPDWLHLALDSAGAPADAQVLVFVDGRMMGDVRVLRGMQRQGVGSLRVRSPDFIRDMYRGAPGRGFRAAIVVATYTRPLEGGPRLSVSAGAGFTLVGLARGTESAAEEAGFISGVPRGSRWADRGIPNPPSLHLTARYAVRPALSVAADVQHTLEGFYGGTIRRTEGSSAVSTTFTSTEAALLASFGRLIRIGAGPAVRQVRWTWVGGLCQCEPEESHTSTAFGVAAEAGVSLPQNRRWFVDFGVRARYYPTQDTGGYPGVEPMDAGGVVLTPAASVGVRF